MGPINSLIQQHQASFEFNLCAWWKNREETHECFLEMFKKRQFRSCECGPAVSARFFQVHSFQFISWKDSFSSVSYLLLVKTSGGMEYPCVLYCKVKGISEKRERVKRRYKLRQAWLCYRTSRRIPELCKLHIKGVSVAYCLWKHAKKKNLASRSLFYFSRPSCAGAVLYRISSQICTYKRAGKRSSQCSSSISFVLEFSVKYYDPIFSFFTSLCFFSIESLGIVYS